MSDTNPSDTVRAYAHRSDFIKDHVRRAGETVEADDLDHLRGESNWTPALPRGSDLPPERRHCPICNEHIDPKAFVARMCPGSHRHVFHWLCMMEWLATWSEQRSEFHRSCPSCRAEMFTLSEETNVTKHARFVLWKVQHRVEVLNTFYRIHTSYRPTQWPYGIDVIDVPGVTWRYDRRKYPTVREYWLAKAMSFLGNWQKITKLRTMIWMYDDEQHLDHLLLHMETLSNLLNGENLELYKVPEPRVACVASSSSEK